MPPSDPQHNGALHGIALTTMLALAASAGAGLWWQARAHANGEDRGPDIDELEVIEASLAYKKPEDKKQPQKKREAPPEKVKEEALLKNPDLKKDDAKKDEPVTKPEDVEPDLDKYRRPNTDEDEEIGKPEEDIGAFDGSEFGFASETKGDPFFQALIADLVKGWEYPELLADEGVPIGCLHLGPDGKVIDTLFKEKSGNGDLDDSVERALKALVKLRDEDPRPVPDHLLKQTKRWICFKFDARKQ